VDLGDVEMIAYAKLSEGILMRMEQTQAVLHSFESSVHVLLELCIGDEVQKRVSHEEDGVFGRT